MIYPRGSSFKVGYARLKVDNEGQKDNRVFKSFVATDSFRRLSDIIRISDLICVFAFIPCYLDSCISYLCATYPTLLIWPFMNCLCLWCLFVNVNEQFIESFREVVRVVKILLAEHLLIDCSFIAKILEVCLVTGL